MKYFVSRQHYWGGPHVVEVAGEGLDYAGPDMLAAKYSDLGEGKEYYDPRQAVEAALNIMQAWQVDVNQRPEDQRYEIEGVAVGFTHGMISQLEPVDPETARQWAYKAYEGLPKCTFCGLLIESEEYHDTEGNLFEREYCFEEYHRYDGLHPNDMWELYKEASYALCPKCGYDELVNDEYDTETSIMHIQCNHCGLRFYEVLAIIGIGYRDHDGESYESDSVEQTIV
jgi:predicted RNA-binding Zn-ribbon protein involved in translation (DUF1610 family)